jgi:TatD DNase family protein
MIDIHTHLYWESYDEDRDSVIARAHAAGVEKMFAIGCTVEESRQCVALADRYPDIFASVGIHPHFFNELVEKQFSIPNFQFSINTEFFNNEIQKLTEELRKLAGSAKVVAIGECGLDYFSHDPLSVVSEEQKEVQRVGFLAQIALAQELALPLIVHCRPSRGTQDAYEDMLDILKNHSSLITHPVPSILHCYMGDTEVTKQFLTLSNVYFSFTGNITYPVKKAYVGTKDDLTETVKLIPLERIFAETDCPFLAPQSKRGERNEPAAVVIVAKRIAEIHGKPLPIVTRALDKNCDRVFGHLVPSVII